MDDNLIVALYWDRDEKAIEKTAEKYGKYCHMIAYNVLFDDLDAEECVNDTYLGAWNSMPPQRPSALKAFLGKITRNLSLNRLERDRAKKRGGGTADVALDELTECIPAADGDPTDEIVLRDVLNGFLRSLPEETMIVFLQRYWYFMPIAEIAVTRKMGESRVKVLLHRARLRLKELLKKEGIVL